MSKYGDIMDTLETAFEGITTDNGYNTDLTSVMRSSAIPMLDGSEQLPLIYLIPGNRLVPVVEDDTNVRYEASVVVYGAAKADSEAGRISAIDGLKADVINMIDTPVNLGSYCLSVNVENVELFVNDVLGQFTIDVVLSYYAPKGSY